MSSSTAPVTARGQETRARIVGAASALVQQRGVAAVTLDDVQAAAGVGRSQIYHYFEDRDALLRAVLDATVDAVLGGSADALAGLGTLAGIERWFALAEAASAERGGVGGCPIGSLVGQLAERDEQSRRSLVDAFARWEAPLVDGLRQLRERGDLRPGTDLDALADAVMAALQGGLLLAQVRRDPDQVRRALDGARAVLRAAAA